MDSGFFAQYIVPVPHRDTELDMRYEIADKHYSQSVTPNVIMEDK